MSKKIEYSRKSKISIKLHTLDLFLLKLCSEPANGFLGEKKYRLLQRKTVVTGYSLRY